MRFFITLLSFLSLALVIGADRPAFSQRHAGYCDQAESTADALACVNKHKQDVQERLNEIYKELSEAQDVPAREKFGAAQQEWVKYRDAQCIWEAEWAETSALERVYELSCMTALTGTRADLLASILNRESNDEPREFGSNPRWMNALAHDNPDVFWRYGNWIRTDLDCDGESEQVMTGVTLDQDKDTKRQNAVIVLAVSSNPATGRPESKIFRLPVTGQNETPSLCKTETTIAVTALPEDQNPDNEGGNEEDKENGLEKTEQCRAALQISDRECQPVLLFWNGKDYELSQTVSGKE